jgi:predicted dehydrogenase/RimJ/RimL family protein N-acetyltransferase
MRVAVLGQGSIGRRHAQIALDLGHRPAVYDPAPRLPPPPGVEQAGSVGECLERADAAIVASPSSEHAAQARAAIEQDVPVLVEKPLALAMARAAELDWLARERGVLLSVAMNLREHPGVRALKDLTSEGAVGEILSVSLWCGSWLPGWHGDADYREAYSARRELGGGALLDVAVHELDYLLWLAGPIRSVGALTRRVSTLQLDVEDVAQLSLELASGGVAQLSADYFDRAYTRGCRIVGAHGTLHWSWERQSLTRYDKSGAGGAQPIPSDVAPTYRRQLERFLRAVEDGAQAPVPAICAQRVLAIVDAARRAAQAGRRVNVAPIPTLREATAEDCELLLSWRNDPCTRRWSRSSREVDREEHGRWLRRTLADHRTSLWLAECDGRPVGQVRVGPREGESAELHIALAPQARGQGLGSAVLVQASARALAGTDTASLYAHVKAKNKASLRAFLAAGFQAAGTAENGMLRLERRRARAGAALSAR